MDKDKVSLNILLVAEGTYGDIYPLIGLGKALRKRGHDVTLITNALYERVAREEGLNFISSTPENVYLELLNNPDIWHPLRSVDLMYKQLKRFSEPTCEIIEASNVTGKTVIVANYLAISARLAQDKLGIPVATVLSSPFLVYTVYDIAIFPTWLPKIVKSIIINCIHHFFIDPKLDFINEFHTKYNLPRVKRISPFWFYSPSLILGFWPEWFASPQPDWPQQMRLIGFSSYDESEINPISQELNDWLNNGEPPIAFMFGTAMRTGDTVFQVSMEACMRLNRRGILLSRHADQIPQNLPSNVRHVDYAPFSQLLPRCAALVHHGGIGTISQALRSGIPQLIKPMAHDQFDNAVRVERLEVGLTIKDNAYNPSKVAKQLRKLLKEPSIKEACREISTRFETPDSLDNACDLIESMLVR